jgi:predicted RNase H-like HicB family nuclease
MDRELLNLNLPTFIYQEEDRYVARIPSLELSAFGRTAEDAEREVGQMALLFLEALSQEGVLDKVLHNLGWTHLYGEWILPSEGGDVEAFAIC